MNDNQIRQVKDFLKNADILKQVASDMDVLGYVGERENKILGYLISISRKLEEPLSGIVVSSVGAGKSKLVDTLQQLTPPEDVIFTSKLTPQSLYYMQKEFLKNKLLIVEERTGSELADYAIRTLQSKGSLTLAAAVKNQTVFFEVKGPVSILETTTSFRLNLENISRCFILHLDESTQQTERIHKYQRFLKTQDGLQLKERIKEIITFHHTIQRSLKRSFIIIPYAQKLSFPTNTPSSRRDNQKFLTLIEAITLLYQYQRKRITRNGVTFIESTPKDYEIAYGLFTKSYQSTLFLAHPKAALLLSKINKVDKAIFSRKDIACQTHWPWYQIRDNIRYLEEAGILEIISKRKGKETLYRLNDPVELTKPEELEENSSSTT